MKKEYDGIQADNVSDWCRKYFERELEDAKQIDGYDILTDLKCLMHDDFFEYGREAENFAKIFKADCDLEYYFDEIKFNAIQYFIEAKKPNGFLASTLKNINLEKSLKFLDEVSFSHFGSLETLEYKGKEHFQGFKSTFESLPLYKKDLYTSIDELILTVRDTVNFAIKVNFEDIYEFCVENLNGFKDKFGDDFENLNLNDNALLEAIVFAKNKQLFDSNDDEIGEQLANLVYNEAVDFMYANAKKSLLSYEDAAEASERSFCLLSNVKSLCEAKDKEVQIKKARR